MQTIVKVIDRNHIEEEDILAAGEVLRRGGLVAFPTETVYGLGADALNAAAAEKTYAAKGRPSDNPLIVHIARLDDLAAIVTEVPAAAVRMAEAFWPGPLTMIFWKAERVPGGTTGGLDTVAVRMPDDEIARRLILAGGGYVSAPSANTSGRPSPTTARHVEEDLSGRIDMILDGGPVEIGLESTIVDMTVTPPMILRPGAVTREMLEKVVGPVEVDRTLLAEDSARAPKAPGMKYRHYAPKAEMILVEGKQKETVQAIRQIAYEQARQGRRVGIIASDETADLYTTGLVKRLGSREDGGAAAHSLYRILREFDEEGVQAIYSEVFPDMGIGMAVMNRLDKAAGHKVIRAEAITRLQKYRRIVFVSDSDSCRAPVAAALLKRQPLLQEYQIGSRGLVVLFHEPLNPLAEELLLARNIRLGGYEAAEFSAELLEEDTLVLTMETAQRRKLLSTYPDFPAVYTLGEFVGEEPEIQLPPGRTREEYEQMFLQIEKDVKKLAGQLNEEAKERHKI